MVVFGELKEVAYIAEERFKQLQEKWNCPEENANLGMAAIDLGEIHSITAVSDQRQGIMITGHKIRSIKRLCNKKLIENRSKLRRLAELGNEISDYGFAQTSNLERYTKVFINNMEYVLVARHTVVLQRKK